MSRLRQTFRAFRVARTVITQPDLMWVSPGHFASPISSRAERAAAVRDPTPLPQKIAGINLNLDGQLALAATLSGLCGDLPWARESRDALRYRYDNRFFGAADGAMYAAILRHFRPRRVVEVGCGWSSALGLDVNELFLGGTAEFTFIEPHADRLLSLMRPNDVESRLMRSRLQDVPLDFFTQLSDGDLLFVDSTHMAKLGSDVNFLFFELLPVITPGVLVHIHDIFYPFEYPENWIRRGRCANEGYMLRAFLQYNGEFEVLLYLSYLQQVHPEVLSSLSSIIGTHAGGSFWMRRVR